MADIASLASLGSGILNGAIDIAQLIQNNKNKGKAYRDLNAWNREATKNLDNQQKSLDALVSGIESLSNPNSVKQYQDMRDSFNPNDYTVKSGTFNNSYNVEDYLNPQKEAILSDVVKAVQNTAAGAGLGHSSGAIQNMTNAAIDKSEQIYNDAYSKMTDQRNFDYGSYTDFINQQQQNLDRIANLRQQQMTNLRGDIQFDQQNRQNAYGMQNDLNQSRLSLGNSIAQSKANLMV